MIFLLYIVILCVQFNSNMNPDLSNYSWPGVLQFLYAQYQKVSLKQNIWFLQRKQLTDRIKQLEGKLAASQAVSVDLRHKNNMLEHCLRQVNNKSEKIKENDKEPEIPIPQRRPRSNKAHIHKILCSLGISNLIENINTDLNTKMPNSTLKIQIPLTTSQNKKIQQNSTKSSKYRQINSLQQHQDGVRDVCFLPDKNYLASVSQDATMKVWNIQKPKQKVQCVATIREHTGPIFTAVHGEGYLFTGGMQGIIRCWDLPKKWTTQSFKKCLIGQWNNSQDTKLQPIWQLTYHPQKKILFSTSSQVAIRSFQILIQSQKVQSKYKHSYVYQSKNSEEQDIPTAICIHHSLLYAGYVNNNFLVQFSLDTQKPLNTVPFNAEGQISTNRIQSNGSIIAGAFEDATIRIFDKSKLVHAFQAHQQPVMSLCFTDNPFQLFSCSQDGAVKLWDLRKYAQVCCFKDAHKRKYDQAGHCISFGSKIVASGGADGVVKLYSADL